MLLRLGIGLAFLALAAYMFSDQQDHNARTATATGTVVRMEQLAKRSDPRVVFYTPDRQQVTFLGDSPLLGGYSVGDNVTVLYEPEHPQRAQIANSTMWLLPTIFAVLGLVFIA
jgi:hypothetical protein